MGTVQRHHQPHTVLQAELHRFIFADVGAVPSEDDIVFSVVTAPAAINRVKVALASNASKYLAYVSNYTVDANGDPIYDALNVAGKISDANKENIVNSLENIYNENRR